MKTSIVVSTIGGIARLFVALAVSIFFPAGTIRYWQAWTLLAVFFSAVLAITLYLMKYDVALLERRLRAGPAAESRKTQKVIQTVAALAFISLFVVSSLDHRFGWSTVPLRVIVTGDGLVGIGFIIVFWVFKTNTFTSGAIEVGASQTTISTGPYMFVRHPMYFGALVLLLGVPLALGSWVGLVAIAPMKIVLVFRLLDEERLLKAKLEGYAAYCHTVRYRLIPFIW